MAKEFGDYWDDLADVKAARGRARNVLRAVRKHHQRPRSVLELGVGSGNVLRHFPATWARYGLDLYEQYLALAQKKMPDAQLLAASMHDFTFERRFDVIFSIFDSINFLENFAQWRSTFKNVYEHLEDDGVFVFDTYTPLMLEKAKTWSIVTEEPFGYMWDKGVVRGNTLTWRFTIFEHLEGAHYEKNEFAFSERIYPVEKVEAELTKRFTILEKIDAETLEAPTDDTIRLLYTAKKTRSL